jgi:hypothetical protein
MAGNSKGVARGLASRSSSSSSASSFSVSPKRPLARSSDDSADEDYLRTRLFSKIKDRDRTQRQRANVASLYRDLGSESDESECDKPYKSYTPFHVRVTTASGSFSTSSSEDETSRPVPELKKRNLLEKDPAKELKQLYRIMRGTHRQVHREDKNEHQRKKETSVQTERVRQA